MTCYIFVKDLLQYIISGPYIKAKLLAPHIKSSCTRRVGINGCGQLKTVTSGGIISISHFIKLLPVLLEFKHADGETRTSLYALTSRACCRESMKMNRSLGLVPLLMA
jgi:hypothetical protein